MYFFADFACHSYQHNILEMFLYLVDSDFACYAYSNVALHNCIHKFDQVGSVIFCCGIFTALKILQQSFWLLFHMGIGSYIACKQFCISMVSGP